jgi:hypothetical protein
MGYIGNAPYQGVLTGGNIQDGTVETTDLADAAVTTAKLHDQAVTEGKLHTTLDLSGKTLTLPAAAVTAHTPVSSVNGQTGAVTVDTSINSSDVTTALGYTPLNKAGDTLEGTHTFGRFDDAFGIRFESRSWNNSTGGTTAYRTAYHSTGWGGDYFFSIYIGSDGTGNQSRYWYLDFNTGAGTWMDYLHLEVSTASWSWSQTAGYRRWTITSVGNSWTTTLREDNAVGTLGALTAHAVPNGSTSLRFGFTAGSLANVYHVRVYHAQDALRNVSTVYYTDTNPF